MAAKRLGREAGRVVGKERAEDSGGDRKFGATHLIAFYAGGLHNLDLAAPVASPLVGDTQTNIMTFAHK